MTLTDMTSAANAYTDESFRTTQTMFFANEAIGAINAELNIELPFIDSAEADWTALSETWIRQVIIPYLCYSIKMSDSSVNEAMVFYRSYENGMQRLNNNKGSVIPEAYKTAESDGVYEIDYTSGLASLGFYPRPYYVDNYDETETYEPGDEVVYLDIVYVCILTSTGNLPTNAKYWKEKG